MLLCRYPGYFVCIFAYASIGVGQWRNTVHCHIYVISYLVSVTVMSINNFGEFLWWRCPAKDYKLQRCRCLRSEGNPDIKYLSWYWCMASYSKLNRRNCPWREGKSSNINKSPWWQRVTTHVMWNQGSPASKHEGKTEESIEKAPEARTERRKRWWSVLHYRDFEESTPPFQLLRLMIGRIKIDTTSFYRNYTASHSAPGHKLQGMVTEFRLLVL